MNLLSQRGNTAILLVLGLSITIGLIIAIQDLSSETTRKEKAFEEAYQAGVDANQAAIALTKTLLEYPNGTLYQEPYYPVNVMSIKQTSDNHSRFVKTIGLDNKIKRARKWAYNNQGRLLIQHKSFHLPEPKEMQGNGRRKSYHHFEVEVEFKKEMIEGRNWEFGKNGPILLAVDIEVTSKPRVKAFPGQKSGERVRTVVHNATIAMQRPDQPVCRAKLKGPDFGFPGVCNTFYTGLMICPRMFIQKDKWTFSGAPVTVDVYCDGVVSEATVLAPVLGQKRLLKDSRHIPTKARSVFGKNVHIGSATFPMWVLDKYHVTYKAAYDTASDPIPEGTQPLPLALQYPEFFIEDHDMFLVAQQMPGLPGAGSLPTNGMPPFPSLPELFQGLQSLLAAPLQMFQGLAGALSGAGSSLLAAPQLAMGAPAGAVGMPASMAWSMSSQPPRDGNGAAAQGQPGEAPGASAPGQATSQALSGDAAFRAQLGQGIDPGGPPMCGGGSCGPL